MRFIKNYALIFSLIMHVANTAAQTNEFCDSMLFIGNYTTSNMVAETYTYPGPKHQKQFYNDWNRGDVYYTNGIVIYDKNLRYNGYSDLFIWMRDKDNKMGVIQKPVIEKVIIHDNTQKRAVIFRQLSIRLPMQITNSNVYFQELNYGKVSFLCLRKIKYIKNTEELYYPDFQYYLMINNELQSIGLKKPLILSKFEKAERLVLKNLAREHKLKFRNEEDLIRLFDLYNEL